MNVFVVGGGSWGTAFSALLRDRFALQGVPVSIDFVRRS